MNKRRIGSIYEAKACACICAQGGIILERNFRCRTGEIDVICRDGDCIAFVEVKYRKNRRHGYAEDAVNLRKQQTICQVAEFYLLRHHWTGRPCRFDVIAIDADADGMEQLRWHKNAFGYVPRR